MGVGRLMVRALAVSVLFVCAGACNSTESKGGQLLSCPADAPSGSCSTEGRICQYPTQSCQCAGGNWTCVACPATQPDPTSDCSSTLSLSLISLACVYDAVTCSCQDELSLPKWRCGACPTIAPVPGEACGNSFFSCVYGDKTCICSETWMCEPKTCPAINLFAASCVGVYTCAYPDQTCACKGGVQTPVCSCPANRPSNGGACGPASCTYGDQTCTCSDSGWMCTSGCPTPRPAAGSACSSDLSCTYPDGLCYCAGGTWHS